MALTVRGSTHAASAGSQSNAATTIPADTQSGDLLIALVHVPASSVTVTPPAGWTALAELDGASSSAAGSLRGMWRRATLGQGGTGITIGLGTSTRWAAVVVAVHDTDGYPVKVEQVVPLLAATQADAFTTPAVTPFTTPTLLLAVPAGSPNVAGAQPTVTAASGWTMVAQATSTAGSLRNSVLGVARKSATGTSEQPAADHDLSTGTSASTSATIVVSSANAPPVADAGPDRTAGPGATVTLSGSASYDLDGSIAGWYWEQTFGPAVTLTGADTATPSFTAPANVAGATLIFALTVTDNIGATSEPDGVTVHVAAQGSAKVRVAGAWETHPLHLRTGDDWL